MSTAYPTTIGMFATALSPPEHVLSGPAESEVIATYANMSSTYPSTIGIITPTTQTYTVGLPVTKASLISGESTYARISTRFPSTIGMFATLHPCTSENTCIDGNTRITVKGRSSGITGGNEAELTNVRMKTLLDLYYNTIRYAYANKFVPEQCSTMFSIIKATHVYSMSEPHMTLPTAFSYFRALLERHNVHRPP